MIRDIKTARSNEFSKELLEKALILSENLEFNSIAIAAEMANGETYTDWARDHKGSDVMLLGGLIILQHRIGGRLVDE